MKNKINHRGTERHALSIPLFASRRTRRRCIKMGFRTQIMRLKQVYTDILPRMPLDINSILIRDNPLNPVNPCSFLF